ncbi:hypothetical protein [Dactylosporangium sp. NPDC051541]|uniref:hypothetical protein n=1 Tax=Dactylosporangium sp. NPDC051541 TaxID=3363977 RepID=UPI0037AEE09C
MFGRKPSPATPTSGDQSSGKRRPAAKPDRVGTFFFQIFGPATVEGAIQGWSPEAQAQYKKMRESHKQAAAARRTTTPAPTDR